MKTLGGTTTTALGSVAVAVVQLIHLDFASGVIALNTSTWSLVHDGVTYLGAYGLGSISAITDKAGELQGVTFELAAGDAARVSLALDSADEVQGTVVTIRTAIIEVATYTVLDAPIEWVGTLDTMTIAEDGATATVRVTAESRAIDLLRGTPWRHTSEEQIIVDGDDLCLSYITDQVDKPIVWPSKAYFQK